MALTAGICSVAAGKCNCSPRATPPARDRALGLASSRWDLGSRPGRSDLGVGRGLALQRVAKRRDALALGHASEGWETYLPVVLSKVSLFAELMSPIFQNF